MKRKSLFILIIFSNFIILTNCKTIKKDILTLDWANYIKTNPGGDDYRDKRSAAIELSNNYFVEAKKYYKKKNYIQAKIFIEKALHLFANGEMYYLFGNTLYDLKNFNASITAWKISIEIGYTQKHLSYYNIACAYSILKNTEESLKYLATAVKNGYRSFQYILIDKDLENVRKDSGFFALFNKLRAKAKLDYVEYKFDKTIHDFDFEGNNNVSFYLLSKKGLQRKKYDSKKTQLINLGLVNENDLQNKNDFIKYAFDIKHNILSYYPVLNPNDKKTITVNGSVQWVGLYENGKYIVILIPNISPVERGSSKITSFIEIYKLDENRLIYKTKILTNHWFAAAGDGFNGFSKIYFDFERYLYLAINVKWGTSANNLFYRYDLKNKKLEFLTKKYNIQTYDIQDNMNIGNSVIGEIIITNDKKYFILYKTSSNYDTTDQKVEVYNLNNSKLFYSFGTASRYGVKLYSINNILYCLDDNTLSLYNISERKFLTSYLIDNLKSNEIIQKIRISPDSKIMVVLLNDNKVRIYKIP